MRRRLWDGSRVPWWWQLRPPIERPRLLYAGLPGAGKTLNMVAHAVGSMHKRVTFANFDLHDPFTGERGGRVGSWADVVRLYAWCREMCEAYDAGKIAPVHVSLFLHEAGSLCPSREFAGLPRKVGAVFRQCRKVRLELVMDTQHELDIDTYMRRVVDYVVLCSAPLGWARGLGLPFHAREYLSLSEVEKVRTGRVGAPRFSWIPAWVKLAYDHTETAEPWPYPDSKADRDAWERGGWRDEPVTIEAPSLATGWEQEGRLWLPPEWRRREPLQVAVDLRGEDEVRDAGEVA